MKVVLVLLFAFASTPCLAAEGFTPSEERNVVMLKGRTDGGTAFIFNDPGFGRVLVTQEHVLEVTGLTPTLQWGYRVGPLFRLHQERIDAYQIQAELRPIWRNDELDIAVLAVPSGLIGLCQCQGLNPALPRDGEAALIGYPITERRIWPRTSGIVRAWREFWGRVTQQTSLGKIWQANGEYLGDMDAISGNSGGPIIQNGQVVGTLHLLKTWKGIGYQYVNPSLNFFPISLISEKLRELKRW